LEPKIGRVLNPVGYGNLPSPWIVVGHGSNYVNRSFRLPRFIEFFMRTFRVIDTAATWKNRRTKKTSRRKKTTKTKEKLNNKAGNR
jgi:hypothetical protein